MNGLRGQPLLSAALGHSSASAVKLRFCAHQSGSRYSQPFTTVGEVRSFVVGWQEPAGHALEVPTPMISGRDKVFSAAVLGSSAPPDSISAASKPSSAAAEWISGVVQASSAAEDASPTEEDTSLASECCKSAAEITNPATEDRSPAAEFSFKSRKSRSPHRKSDCQHRKSILQPCQSVSHHKNQ